MLFLNISNKIYNNIWTITTLRCSTSSYEEKIKEIEDAYTAITGQKMTRNKIFKKLQALSDKTMKKLDKLLPKLCVETLNNVLITDDKCMAVYLNIIDE